MTERIRYLISNDYPDIVIQHFIAEIILKTPQKDRNDRKRFKIIMDALYGVGTSGLVRKNKDSDEQLLITAALYYNGQYESYKDSVTRSCRKVAEEIVHRKRYDTLEYPKDFKKKHREEIQGIMNRIQPKFQLHLKHYQEKAVEELARLKMEFLNPPNDPSSVANELHKIALSIEFYNSIIDAK